MRNFMQYLNYHHKVTSNVLITSVTEFQLDTADATFPTFLTKIDTFIKVARQRVGTYRVNSLYRTQQ